VSYRVALERLSISAPMPAATDLDRSLVALGNLIDHHRLLPAPDVAPGPGVVTMPPFQGPVLGPRGRPLSVLGSVTPAMPSAIAAAKLDPQNPDERLSAL
jgi:hypothetical protein